MSFESPGKQEARHADGASDQNKHLILPEIVRGIIDAMTSANITELEIEHHELRLVLKAGNPGHGSDLPAPDARGNGLSATPPATDGVATHVVTAPMIGTFYVAPAPGEEPFVQAGDRVEEGQSIGIIEAMKIMNEIAADCSGEVVEILVDDGQTVEYGSPLVRLRVGG